MSLFRSPSFVVRAGLLSIALSLMSPLTLQAQDTVPPAPEFGWKNSANGNLNLSQAYFDNWTKGGSNTLAWETRIEAVALRKETDWEWESKAKVAFGQSRLEDLGTRKSSDELVLETIYTQHLSAWVNPFASARVQSQFAPGYVYDDTVNTRERVSGFWDPTYVTQTVGLGKSWEEAYTVRVGASLKETFSAARYGYAGSKGYRVDPGASLVAEMRRGIMENILLVSVLDIFADFRGMDAVDVRWENQITAKVNSFISTNVGLDVLYDKDLSTSRQIRQSLAVGISFLSI